MDAPERIYIHPTLDNLYGMSERSCDNEIEYVRKDSFIDKVSDWLDKNLYDFYDGEDEFGKCSQGKTAHEFIKDFNKYMKGE